MDPLNPEFAGPIRLGFVIPERNVACETEFPRHLPEGVSAHFTRLPREGAELTQASLIRMMDSVEQQAKLLAGIDVRIVLYACTSGSFLGEADALDTIADRISACVGVPAVTTTRAVLDAFDALKARRLFLLSPYPADIHGFEVDFFDKAGYPVRGDTSFECARSEMIREISSREVADLALRHWAEIAECDAVFLSCTNLRSMDQIAALEAELDRPVISSNSATLWRAMRGAGLPPTDIGAGRLFGLDLAQADKAAASAASSP
ncbi:maleate cis-trans isomerase [Amorphus sp. 3PC139-8]|uniref:maleate cis-trans isomerase family protein n=1 Tax=Amorphus sp. 3PC139-8 TaxID=2735676 RepID=UPI00345D47A2